MWISFDDGANWQSLQLELPAVPITDLTIKDGDLIAATTGRGFWSLDELGVIRQLSPEIAREVVHLFKPEDAWRTRGFTARRPARNQGTNPPNGVVVHYRVDRPVGTPVKIEFLAADGKVIRTFEGAVAGKKKELKPTPGEIQIVEGTIEKKEEEKKKEDNRIEDVHPGMNRFVWDLSWPPAKKVEKMILWSDDGLEGPRALPGTYRVRLTVGDEVENAEVRVVADPRSKASAADLQRQFEFLLAIRDKLTETHEAIERIRELRAQLASVKKRLGDSEAAKPAAEKAKAIEAKVTAVEEALYQTKNQSSQDPLNFPIRLNDKLAHVASSASTGDYAPTAQAIAVRDELVAKIDAELAKLKAVVTDDVPELNRLAREAEVPAVVVK